MYMDTHLLMHILFIVLRFNLLALPISIMEFIDPTYTVAHTRVTVVARCQMNKENLIGTNSV